MVLPLWSATGRRTTNAPLATNHPTVHTQSLQSPALPILHSPAPLISADSSSALPPPVSFPGNVPSVSRKIVSRSSQYIIRQWERIANAFGSASSPSGASCTSESLTEATAPRSQPQYEKFSSDYDPGVDQVVVDRQWSEDMRGSPSDFEFTPVLEEAMINTPKHMSAKLHNPSECGESPNDSTLMTLLRWIWRGVRDVFSPRFAEWHIEQKYMEENWRLKKSLAVLASIWLIANWVLGCSFASKPLMLVDKIFLFGVVPALSFPVGLMVFSDWPRDRPVLYQTILLLATWCWAFYQILFMYLCGFYSGTPKLWDCSTREFLGIFHYTTALPTIALFGLKLNRFPAAIGATTFFVFSCVIMIPQHLQWTRTMINFAIFHIFLIYIHYMRENSERRLFRLSDQLNMQYEATRIAQLNERHAAESKRRLTSYVRVPLNAAMIAVENIDAAKVMTKDQEYDFNALKESLSMMSKVLNDVLDFHRMDSGRLEVTPMPFSLHATMRSLFMPLSLATKARGLEFVTELDPAIDSIARRTAYAALGEEPEVIEAHIAKYPDVDGVVLADAPRIQQVVTNLASNACKFTPPGGRLTVRTKLIFPGERDAVPSQPSNGTIDQGSGKIETIKGGKVDAYSDKIEKDQSAKHRFGTTWRSQRRRSHRRAERKRVGFEKDYKSASSDGSCKPEDPLAPVSSPNWIVVRIEIIDTGSGIRRRDIEQNKLFSAFTQTEQGRQQGGKGSGLGLALVRQIVKLSGGRLGVKSQVGEGSLFWVELPVGIGTQAVEAVKHMQAESQIKRSGTGFYQEDTHTSTNVIDAFSVQQAETAAPQPKTSPILRSLLEQGFIDYPLSQLSMGSDVSRNGKPKNDKDVLAIRTDGAATPTPHPHTPLSQSVDHDESIHNLPSPRSKKRITRPTCVPLPSPQKIIEEPVATALQQEKILDNTNSALYKFDSIYNHKGRPTTPKPTPTFSSGLPVLVVDDDPLTRNLMQRLLTRLGCRVTLAENGEAALKLVLGPAAATVLTPASDKSRNLDTAEDPTTTTPSESIDFAVIFLDNQMPVMSGLIAVGKLRSLGRKDFVVGVTGNALLSDQQEYLAAGVNYVLTKPVLEARLREILALADARQKQCAT